MNLPLCFQPSWCTRKSTGRLRRTQGCILEIDPFLFGWPTLLASNPTIAFSSFRMTWPRTQAFWSPEFWDYLRPQSRLFNHLAHGVVHHPHPSMSLNVLNGKFARARSAKAFFDSVHMGAGLNVGELLRVKGRRRSVSLKEQRGMFFFLSGKEWYMWAFSLFLWLYFILKLGHVMMKVCMAQGPQYQEAYLTLQASLISALRSLSNLGRTGTAWAGRSTASMASPLPDKMWTRSLRRATLGATESYNAIRGFRVLIRDFFGKFGTGYIWAGFVCRLFGIII